MWHWHLPFWLCLWLGPLVLAGRHILHPTTNKPFWMPLLGSVVVEWTPGDPGSCCGNQWSRAPSRYTQLVRVDRNMLIEGAWLKCVLFTGFEHCGKIPLGCFLLLLEASTVCQGEGEPWCIFSKTVSPQSMARFSHSTHCSKRLLDQGVMDWNACSDFAKTDKHTWQWYRTMATSLQELCKSFRRAGLLGPISGRFNSPASQLVSWNSGGVDGCCYS